MTKSVYITSPEGLVGKSTIALGLLESLGREVTSVGLFRPVVKAGQRDQITESLLAQLKSQEAYDEAVGVTYDDVAANPDDALGQIVSKFGEVEGKYDALVILGSDYTDVATPTELSYNATIAANLNAPVILVVRGRDRTPEQINAAAQQAIAEIVEQHNNVIAVIATRVASSDLDAVKSSLAELGDNLVVASVPESTLLAAPTVRAQFEKLGAKLWKGDERNLDRESLGVTVAGMTLPNLLTRLGPEETLVVASDRSDLLPGLLLAHNSGTFPSLASIVLVGGYPIPSAIEKLLDGLNVQIPIGTVDLGTYRTAALLSSMEGVMTSSTRKLDEARALFHARVDDEALLRALDVPRAQIRTPRMFEYQLMRKARSNKKTIVLPESEDPRILEAASILLRRGVANLVLLGDPNQVPQNAFGLGFDITGARIVSMNDPALVEKFSTKYAELRAHKGITLEQARERMTDGAYFGTMMVYFGMADGLVSGANHTTANTIRPALEFIKTKPDVSTVSGAFLMAMSDQVLVMADCAVTPDPTASQLADIAITSAATAQAFDIEPRIAMLSYSTGTSGAGEDVDKVREATELARSRAPELKIDGPIQFDAAIDPVVGQKKMPDSEVAGRATVFIFPDLNTGNNTYKAVQRTAGAIAIGPVLQGLRKPVNDLSRGALVEDIVNTVAITAIQAQSGI
mgnify:CR=1 FL=1